MTMLKNRLLKICAALLVLVLLAGCAAGAGGSTAASDSAETDAAEETLDPNLSASGEYILSDIDMSHYVAADDNAIVFYEIFVGSFSDSNGDGIGDLRGIINRMDYLNDGDPTSGESLGVEGIWLSPIFQSSSYHKYDVDDYYTIDPDFGTMDDLVELLELCHERGVKVILDLVINHTGKGNEMFEAFVKAHQIGDVESEYYDFYSYYTSGESAPSGRTYTLAAGTDIYYECNFSNDMPELNYDNEAVREAMLDVAKYYLDLGVDGFRFDAAKYIYYGDNSACVEFWDWYCGELHAYKSDVYTVAEVWDSDAITIPYFSATNCFDFAVSQSGGYIATAAKAGNVNTYTKYVAGYIDSITALNEDALYVPFIANHDTDRAAGYLTVSDGSAMMAANLYLLGPGSPFLYYGEEIGMKGSRGGASTDANRRLAMLWGDGDSVSDPEGSTYSADSQINGTVADQLGDSGSLYNYYKALLMIRAANPEIARGEYTALSLSGSVGGFTSTWNGSTVAVLHNTTSESYSVDISTLGDFSAIAAAIGLGEATLDGTTLTLEAQTSVVLR
ncbi:MAG: hypothetical protein LUH51_06320 [Firmicutes bacterium]|nr:hypothetical protein [Bacillota bacterium]